MSLRDRLDMPTMEESLKLFELGSGFELTPEIIKTKFRLLSKTKHPDGGGKPGEFEKLIKARDVLTASLGGTAPAGIRVDVNMWAGVNPFGKRTAEKTASKPPTMDDFDELVDKLFGKAAKNWGGKGFKTHEADDKRAGKTPANVGSYNIALEDVIYVINRMKSQGISGGSESDRRGAEFAADAIISAIQMMRKVDR